MLFVAMLDNFSQLNYEYNGHMFGLKWEIKTPIVESFHADTNRCGKVSREVLNAIHYTAEIHANVQPVIPISLKLQMCLQDGHAMSAHPGMEWPTC